MHILLTFPFSLGIPGGGTYAFIQTARFLKKAGADVSVIFIHGGGLKLFNRSPLKQSRSGEVQIQALRDMGIKVHPAPVYRWSYLIDVWTIKQAVNKLAQQYELDAILGWHQEVALLRGVCDKHNLIFAIRAAGNYELTRHHRKGQLWSWVIFRLLRHGFKQADIIWATSDFTRQDVINAFNLNPEKVAVIPEGINPDFLVGDRKRDPRTPIRNFLFFGQWTEIKGIFDVLQAFGQLSSQGNRDWKLQIAGWGEEEYLWHAIQENGILNQVEVIGKLDHDTLINALKAAEVVILPSHIESFGLAVAEALASGVPVIAYDTGAIPELIEDGITGWLVPLKRIDLLANTIKESMVNPEQTYRMGLAARDDITARFSWEQTAVRYLEALEKLKESRK